MFRERKRETHKPAGLEKTWGWLNDERIDIFGWFNFLIWNYTCQTPAINHIRTIYIQNNDEHKLNQIMA